METKRCSKCGEIKPIDCFHKAPDRACGRKSHCKECIREYRQKNKDVIKKQNKEWRERTLEERKMKSKEYYRKNKKRIDTLNRQYIKNNPEKIQEIRSNYYKENKEEIINKRRERIALNPDYHKNKWQKYYSKNKDTHIEYRKMYEKENKEAIAGYRSKMRKKKRETNPIYALSERMRKSIHFYIVRKGYTKKTKTEEILGCSFEDFKKHIEKQFSPWMTWENRGIYTGKENEGWDLDHIVPIATAKTEQDLINLNHYTNFQPLCSYINRHVKKDLILKP